MCLCVVVCGCVLLFVVGSEVVFACVWFNFCGCVLTSNAYILLEGIPRIRSIPNMPILGSPGAQKLAFFGPKNSKFSCVRQGRGVGLHCMATARKPLEIIMLSKFQFVWQVYR